MVVAAFDPGRNVGFALVDETGELLDGRVLAAEEVAGLALPVNATVVVGGGTGSRELLKLLSSLGARAEVVDELGTSLEGRRLYFERNPPAFPWRLVPRGLWVPPRPIDDFAAYAIALRYLSQRGRGAGETGPPR